MPFHCPFALQLHCHIACASEMNLPCMKYCLPAQAVLKSICEAAKAVSTDVSASSSMQSFYAVLLCELLLATHPVRGHLCTSVFLS